ncbi:hypothetical protein GMRT_11245 [Giardia muris]|uniref:Uncharacterized protein n=1 Tax=Giardia muris TaxID=5742 RepID=A0A4Z1SR27_GIAMU|nr:hypothetical protein GMRT_11245 [Giardia muris]|eukprot:TNJ28306.1 hypothetical protein GMRT_11245 [Giardia muris]
MDERLVSDIPPPPLGHGRRILKRYGNETPSFDAATLKASVVGRKHRNDVRKKRARRQIEEERLEERRERRRERDAIKREALRKAIELEKQLRPDDTLVKKVSAVYNYAHDGVQVRATVTQL